MKYFSPTHRRNISKAVSGKPKSAEHRAKISAGLRGHIPWNKGKAGYKMPASSPTKKARISAALTGKPRPYMIERNRLLRGDVPVSEGQKRKISRTMRRARRTYAPIWNKGLTAQDHAGIASAAEKNALSMVGRARPYRSDNRGWRRFWYYGPDRNLRMRSRWEVTYAHWLDEQGIEWVYEPVTFIAPLFSYTPDFYFPSKDLFVEIKGRTTDAARYKIYALRERFRCKIMFIGGVTLQKLGLLDAHLRVVRKIGGQHD